MDCEHKGKIIERKTMIPVEIYYCKDCGKAIWFRAEIDGELTPTEVGKKDKEE